MKLTDLKSAITKLLTEGNEESILLSSTDFIDMQIFFTLNKAVIQTYLDINSRTYFLKNITLHEWISTDHRIIYNDLKLGILTAIKHIRNDLSQISCDLQEKSKND